MQIVPPPKFYRVLGINQNAISREKNHFFCGGPIVSQTLPPVRGYPSWHPAPCPQPKLLDPCIPRILARLMPTRPIHVERDTAVTMDCYVICRIMTLLMTLRDLCQGWYHLCGHCGHDQCASKYSMTSNGFGHAPTFCTTFCWHKPQCLQHCTVFVSRVILYSLVKLTI